MKDKVGYDPSTIQEWTINLILNFLAVNPFLQQPDKFDAIEEEEDDIEAEKSFEKPAAAADPIDSMCQQLSQEITAAVASPSESAANNNPSQQVSYAAYDRSSFQIVSVSLHERHFPLEYVAILAVHF